MDCDHPKGYRRTSGCVACERDHLAESVTEMTHNAERRQGEIERLQTLLDAAHGLICNAHQKRVDDVTTDDGASPGWAEAARRWIDAYPFGAFDAELTSR